MISRITASARSAATDTIARSAASGSSASEPKARQPSISAAFGWMAQMRSFATPPPSTRLRRMMRPGFRPSAEAPITTALRGTSSRCSSPIGRAGGSGCGRCSRARPSSATRRPSSAATIGFTSSSARPRPPGGAKPAHSLARRASATARSPSFSSGQPWPRLERNWPVKAAWTSVPRSAPSARSRVRPSAASITRARSGRSPASSASVSSPPTPRTTTAPKAGSWRNEARISRPVPARKRTRSTISAPSRRASRRRRAGRGEHRLDGRAHERRLVVAGRRRRRRRSCAAGRARRS